MQSIKCLTTPAACDHWAAVFFARNTQETPKKAPLLLSRYLLKVSKTEQIIPA
jgi:hypothetical protein